MNSGGIIQKITRSKADGCDRFVGIFRCDFEAGQNRYVLNVPIHPPMAGIPEVEAMILQGTGRTRITDCEKFGIRIEVVLNETCNQTCRVFLETVVYSFTQ